MANINVTSVTVHPVNLQLQLNGYAFVTATVCPANATCRSVTWTSSNTNVATVNSTSGLVMARAAYHYGHCNRWKRLLRQLPLDGIRSESYHAEIGRIQAVCYGYQAKCSRDAG